MANAKSKETSLTLERVPHGYRVFDGPSLVAVIDTQQQVVSPDDLTKEQLLHRDQHRAAGPVYWRPMDPADWQIHFTRPQMTLDLLREVVAALPSEA